MAAYARPIDVVVCDGGVEGQVEGSKPQSSLPQLVHASWPCMLLPPKAHLHPKVLGIVLKFCLPELLAALAKAMLNLLVGGIEN